MALKHVAFVRMYLLFCRVPVSLKEIQKLMMDCICEAGHASGPSVEIHQWRCISVYTSGMYYILYNYLEWGVYRPWYEWKLARAGGAGGSPEGEGSCVLYQLHPDSEVQVPSWKSMYTYSCIHGIHVVLSIQTYIIHCNYMLDTCIHGIHLFLSIQSYIVLMSRSFSLIRPCGKGTIDSWRSPSGKTRPGQ